MVFRVAVSWSKRTFFHCLSSTASAPGIFVPSTQEDLEQFGERVVQAAYWAQILGLLNIRTSVSDPSVLGNKPIGLPAAARILRRDAILLWPQCAGSEQASGGVAGVGL
jgi:hypothetical protein